MFTPNPPPTTQCISYAVTCSPAVYFCLGNSYNNRDRLLTITLPLSLHATFRFLSRPGPRTCKTVGAELPGCSTQQQSGRHPWKACSSLHRSVRHQALINIPVCTPPPPTHTENGYRLINNKYDQAKAETESCSREVHIFYTTLTSADDSRKVDLYRSSYFVLVIIGRCGSINQSFIYLHTPREGRSMAWMIELFFCGMFAYVQTQTCQARMSTSSMLITD